MITMLGSRRRCCDRVTRRETLRAGALALGGGMHLPGLLRAEEAMRPTPSKPGKAKSVIVLYLLGGAATQDMVDMKPDAPSEVRGEFKPVPSNVPGMDVCEHLPGMARWMHRAAVVRSVNHKAGCHNPLPSYTGFEQPLPDIVSTRAFYPPSMGSVCEYLKEDGGLLPSYMYLPCYLGWGQAIRRPGPYAGFLGNKYDALYTECTPYIDKDAPRELPGQPQVCRGVPRLPDGVQGNGVTLDRFSSRRSLLQQFDDQVRLAEASPGLDAYDRHRRRAYELLTSTKVKAAFNLDSEDPKLIDRYGRSLFGNSTLIARRLVEAGVRFVNVTWDIFWDRFQIQYDGWDTHTRNFSIMRDYNLPYFDRAYSALLGDLESRGLLDETLVVVMSEMGRTPKINANGGRDHWTYCYSHVFAGAGIRGGTIHGASDSQAAYVKDNPVSTGDVCATIYRCLGIDPALTVPDRTNRPMPIANGGQPIEAILA
ncbi:MAG: DUF1501 domain-containing protein [Isosphaeraceae bacterium]|nr:DUF1501 domain-containing protein [Isosphaeraceae bacterium]